MANRWKDTMVKKDKYTKKNLEMSIEKLQGENWSNPTSRSPPMPWLMTSCWRKLLWMQLLK